MRQLIRGAKRLCFIVGVAAAAAGPLTVTAAAEADNGAGSGYDRVNGKA